MADFSNNIFIGQLNRNLGIAHKVCRVYLNDREDQEDAFQEMMYQLWRSYPRFDGRSSFSTWMYSVCLNTAFTYHKKHKRRKTETLSEQHYEVPDYNLENPDQEITNLFAAIATLSPVNKAIVLLYLEEISYEGIAEITGLSKSNVSVRLVRIKKELENILTTQTKK